MTVGDVRRFFETPLFSSCRHEALYLLAFAALLLIWWHGLSWIGEYTRNPFGQLLGFGAWLKATIFGFVLAILYVPGLAVFLAQAGAYFHACSA